MEIKNANFGSIDSQGGPISIGDTKVTYIIEGLSQLLLEFKEQLKTIETLTNQFKVRTALALLIDLELRAKEIEHPDKNKILGKISYLKAVCKREFPETKTEDAAKDFITAYKLNSSDISFRDRACIEYLNLHEPQKSISLAEDILKWEEFNLAAWYVKAVTSSDLKSFILTIPKTVLTDYNFQLGLIQHILLTGTLNFFEDLSEYQLTLYLDFSKYKDLSFSNLEAWRIAIDLAVNIFFNDHPEKYVSGEKFNFQSSEAANSVFKLLTAYVEKLQNTELKDSIIHQQFFLYYFSYLINNKTADLDFLKGLFPKIDKEFWFYTFCFCQILNHNSQFDLSLEQVLNYETQCEKTSTEFYLFKSSMLLLCGRINEVSACFSDYLHSIDIIDQRNGLNIIKGILNILYIKAGSKDILPQLEKVRKKNFINNELKSLLEITITTRYLDCYDTEQIFEDLIKLLDCSSFDFQWKTLIAENLNAIEKRKEAVNYLKTFVDKKTVNESLRFYIIILYEQLCDKNDQERGLYDELLELLKFWRINSKYPDEKLLQYEHNLYNEINHYAEIEEIDAYLYEHFPDNEQYILMYLNVLEQNRNFEKIKEISDNIKWEFENEHFGVVVSTILMRTKIDIEKGFRMLFKLASNPNNTTARKNYFASSLLLKEQQFFTSYKEVKIGHWVTYMVGEKKEHLKIERESGLQKEFIGRKSGEIFTHVGGFSGKIITIQILEILNDAWHLLRNIQEEANNPINELGFESIQIPPNTDDFINLLKSQLGTIGLKEKEIKEKAFDDYNNYRIGFSEVSRIVFRENHIDSYLHLTSNLGSKFTTIPSFLTKPVAAYGKETNFGIDFSTLMLFYFLEKELEFEFTHRFAISYLVKNEIDREIEELGNSPSSSMTLQITPQFIRKYDTPEDYNQKRTEFLQLLLEWIEKNCKIDLVPEKLDLLPKFANHDRIEGMMKMLVDNLCISDRDNWQLISSDSTLFLFTRNSNTMGNIVNPEKYLSSFYPEKCDSEFYRFLLKSNYIGINITLDTLKNEFYQYLSNGKNFYSLCLENLQYNIHVNPKIVVMLSKFLKDLYIMQVLSLEKKNMYAHAILSRAFYGMPREVIIDFNKQVATDFKLMGNLYDQVSIVAKSILQ